MRKTFTILIILISLFALIAQFYLMMQNRVSSIPETILRFFGFFTILTNLIVTLFFIGRLLNARLTYKPGVLTAVTVYIFIVGIVYQVLLRHLWQPTGLQLVVDELLHTVNPILVVLFWCFYEKKGELKYHQVKYWCIYPLAYFIVIMIRGASSGFYPYPFVNVNTIGYGKALLNSGFLSLFFMAISVVFVGIGRKMTRPRDQ